MPTVPVTPIATVRNRGFGGQFINAETPESQGAGVGRALQGVGQQLDVAAERLTRATVELNERRDTLAAQKAARQAEDEIRQLLHDPEKGVFTRLGENALGATTEVTRVLGDIRRRTSEGMNPQAMQKFDLLMDRLRSSSLDSVSHHEARQFRAAENAEFDAAISTITQTAISNYTNPALVDEHLDRALVRLEAQRASQGWGKDQYEMRKAGLVSTVRIGVVQHLASLDPGAAVNYYEQHITEINDPEGRLLAAVKRISAEQEAFSMADSLIGQYGPTRALAVARKQLGSSNPALRTAVESYLKSRIAEARSNQEEYRRGLRSQITDKVLGGADINDPELKALMVKLGSTDAIGDVLRLSETVRRSKSEPDRPQTALGSELYANLAEAFTAGDEEVIKQYDLGRLWTDVRGHVDDSHFESLLSIRRTAVAASERRDAKASDLSKVTSKLFQEGKTALASMGYDIRNTANNKELFKVTRLQGELARLAEERAKEGKDLNSFSERQAVLNEALRNLSTPVERKGDVFGSVWTDTETLLDIKPDKVKDIVPTPFERIPAVIRERLLDTVMRRMLAERSRTISDPMRAQQTRQSLLEQAKPIVEDAYRNWLINRATQTSPVPLDEPAR